MKISNITENTEDFTGNVWLLENGEKVLIDAGTGDSWSKIQGLESVDKVVITHSHYDHVDSLPKIADSWNPKIYAYEPGNLPVESQELDENKTLELAGVSFRILHTPGHRDDSICLYSEKKKLLFTGDLIFPEGGFGRTDLEEGDRDLLIESIEKIEGLDVEEFYPGHDGAVTENSNKQIQRSLENAKKREPKY